MGLFLTGGDRELFRHFLAAYGYQEAALTDELSRRIMVLLLLHRYGNLRRFLDLLPAGRQFSRLQELEQHWFGV